MLFTLFWHAAGTYCRFEVHAGEACEPVAVIIQKIYAQPSDFYRTIEVVDARAGTRPYRLGAFVDGVGWVEHEYGRVWQRMPSEIVAAPDHGHIDLILDLAARLEPPFSVRYVLLVPRGPAEDEGQFEIAEPMSFAELEGLLRRYRQLFEGDGRHHIVLTSADKASIRYDQHNVLYLRGSLEDFEAVLLRYGLREGEVIFPSPHSHHYHDELDSMLDDMLERYEWTRQTI